MGVEAAEDEVSTLGVWTTRIVFGALLMTGVVVEPLGESVRVVSTASSFNARVFDATAAIPASADGVGAVGALLLTAAEISSFPGSVRFLLAFCVDCAFPSVAGSD